MTRPFSPSLPPSLMFFSSYALLLLRPPPAPSAQFNSMWDNKMKEYEQRAGELLEAMRQVRARARANPSPDPGPGTLIVPQPPSLALNPPPKTTP